MPLRRRFCPQLSLTHVSAQTLELTLTQAEEPLQSGPLNLVVIAHPSRVGSLQEVDFGGHHSAALISQAGQLCRDFHGRLEAPKEMLPDFLGAFALAGQVLEPVTSRHRRILVVADELQESRLAVRHAVERLFRQDIAVDVVASSPFQDFWLDVTGQSFGRMVMPGSTIEETVNKYLATWERAVVTGCEVNLSNLVGVGSQWLANRTTLPPLLPGEIQTLRIQVPEIAAALGRQEVVVRFPGLRYSTALPVPESAAKRQAV